MRKNNEQYYYQIAKHHFQDIASRHDSCIGYFETIPEPTFMLPSSRADLGGKAGQYRRNTKVIAYQKGNTPIIAHEAFHHFSGYSNERCVEEIGADLMVDKIRNEATIRRLKLKRNPR